jgi:hypothetical protein
MRRAAFLLAILMVALASGPAAAPQASRPANKPGNDINLPPLSYVCVMAGDEDVVEDAPGKCRKCGMELQPIRLDTVWTCLNNTSFVADKPGKCPTDGRPLVQMTMSVSWSCTGAPDAKPSLKPGTCADGTPMQRQYAPRAHGNHNPQHGGSFFMAPDNWHHLEGAYFAPGVFRLYLYDDFTRPLPLDQVRATAARLILSPGTKDSKEFPLVRNGRFLEAKVGKLPFPTELQAKVKFRPTTPEHLFDFTFEQYSRDVPAVPTTTVNTANTRPAPGTPSTGGPTTAPNVPASPAPALIPSAPSAGLGSPGVIDASGVDSALLPLPVPETVPEMLAQLQARNNQIKTFIDRGAYASVYVPAFQAKDVALALDAKKSDLPPDRQKIVSPAVNQLVRTAYLLDAFGDLGNKQQISDAYTQFAAAVQEIQSAFPNQP